MAHGRAVRRGAPLLLLGALLACHPRAAEGPPREPAASATTGDTVVLTAAAPRAVVPLDLASIPAEAEVAEVRVARIENEAGTPFSVRLRLAWGGAADGVALGVFTVHPPRRPGRYLLGVREELRSARAALRGSPGARASLVLELVPLAPGGFAGEALRVHVAPAVWRRAP